MPKSIVERLYDCSWASDENGEKADLMHAAADRIQRLEAAGDALAEAHYHDGVCWGCGCAWDDNGTLACVDAGRPCPPQRPERTAAALATWQEARQ